MTRALTVSIDAMGGDAGPGVVVSALLKTILRHPDVNFVLHGDEAQLTQLVARHAALKVSLHYLSCAWAGQHGRQTQPCTPARQRYFDVAHDPVRERW